MLSKTITATDCITVADYTFRIGNDKITTACSQLFLLGCSSRPASDNIRKVVIWAQKILYLYRVAV
ncbi:MAG: hypothetical protein Q4E55_04715 [Bacteroidales bacterium]|nr:hypothetical protein [Bacteroidales bacterium]